MQEKMVRIMPYKVIVVVYLQIFSGEVVYLKW